MKAAANISITLDKSYLAFGNDLFDSTSTAGNFSIHYISGLYGLIKDGYYMEHDGNRCNSLFDIARDPLLKDNLVSKGVPAMSKLELFIKAYIQQYNNRLIENRMVVDEGRK